MSSLLSTRITLLSFHIFGHICRLYETSDTISHDPSINDVTRMRSWEKRVSSVSEAELQFIQTQIDLKAQK